MRVFFSNSPLRLCLSLHLHHTRIRLRAQVAWIARTTHKSIATWTYFIKEILRERPNPNIRWIHPSRARQCGEIARITSREISLQCENGFTGSKNRRRIKFLCRAYLSLVHRLERARGKGVLFNLIDMPNSRWRFFPPKIVEPRKTVEHELLYSQTAAKVNNGVNLRLLVSNHIEDHQRVNSWKSMEYALEKFARESSSVQHDIPFNYISSDKGHL